MNAKPELLAPAGQPDAGYAALHYGADAVYLGLNRFSARAEAVNFSPDELARFVAHARSLTPRRRVYLTLNTLVQQDELADAARTLLVAAECGVDAVIVQDWGVARLVRDRFPDMHLHASTQMAIHNMEGARMARELGCSRVTLARELTLGEVAAIVQDSGLEVETFIHGTLCYSYSGLCLFSSVVTGRSGNRGRCVYSCREAAEGPTGRSHPFSLKDMSLGPRVLDLANAGVHSLKIEGRKKSPLYVAATVDYYRRLLDGGLQPDSPDEHAAADRLKTIFARPWTRLYIDSAHNPDVADPDIVGHRGAPLGTVDRLVRTPAGHGIAFRPRLALERHDGIQLDIPGVSRPYGFAVDNLYLTEQGAGKGSRPQAVFAAPAGADVLVTLPPDAPAIRPGMAVWQSSSQEVKRSYPFPRPKAEAFARRLRTTVSVSITLNGAQDGSRNGEETCRITATASTPPPPFLAHYAAVPLAARAEARADAFPARDPAGTAEAVEKAFARSGGSRFLCDAVTVSNDDRLYVKPGVWNSLRRELLERLEQEYQRRLEEADTAVKKSLPRVHAGADTGEAAENGPFAWSLCVDDVASLDPFTDDDFAVMAEVCVGLMSFCNAPAEKLDALAARAGSRKIRLIPPLVMRPPLTGKVAEQMARLNAAGWTRWLAGNAGSLEIAKRLGADDIQADWPLYAMNLLSVEKLFSLGCRSFTVSPEDDAENMTGLIRSWPGEAHIPVYATPPLFISAACAHVNMGLCAGPGRDNACGYRDRPVRVTLEKSGPVEIMALQCGSVVTGDAPYSILDRVKRLGEMGARNFRVDLRWRPVTGDAAVAIWRTAVSGKIASGIHANFTRGLI